MKRLLFCLLIPALCTNPLHAGQIDLLREPVREGINAIYDLDYAKAQKIFDQLIKENPESPVGYGMTALRAWHELLFASRNLAIYKYGIPTPFDDVDVKSRPAVPSQLKQFMDANTALQKFCEKLLNKNPKDVLALYFKGVSYENLSTQKMTLERRFWDAKSLAKEAEEWHEKVLALDPNLSDAKTSSAVLQYVAGSYSPFVRWIVRLAGIHGDRDAGTAKLQEVSLKGIYRSTDARVVLALLESWRGEPQRSISLFKEVRKEHPRSFLCDISLALAYEEAGKDPRAAITVYEDLLRDLTSKATGILPGDVHYRIARNYVTLQNTNLALEHFQKTVESGQSDRETKPLAYYEMGRLYEKTNRERASECYRLAVQNGSSLPLIREVMKEAKKKIR